MAHAHAGHAHAGHAHGRHDHGRGNAAGPLQLALAATVLAAAVELAGGLAAHSLALLADAAHVFLDAAGLGIAVAAAYQARRPATARHSYGYARAEVLAALANGFLLVGVTVAIAIAAVHRFGAPDAPAGGLMAIVAVVGLAINLAIGAGLARGAHADLNVRAAVLHVAGDALGALAAIAGGLVILRWHLAWIDPALSLVVAAIVLWGVVGIVREAADVLLESAPEHAQIPVVRERMLAAVGVVDVHDLHVWTLGGGSHVLTAHVLLADARISDATAILRDLEARLLAEFEIDHVTLQFECVACSPDDRIACVRLAASSPESNAPTL